MSDAPSQARGLDYLDYLAALLATAQAGIAAWIWRYGPAGALPIHFSLNGQANGWADRHFIAWLLGGQALLTLFLAALLHRVARRSRSSSQRRTFAIARFVMLLVLAFATIMFALAGMGRLANEEGDLSRPEWLVAGLWLLSLVMGALLGKAGPNPIFGVRIYWTRHSRLAWDKSNRLLGRILFFGSLIGLAGMPLAGLAGDVVLLLAVTGGGSMLAIYESWRIWRLDPDRT